MAKGRTAKGNIKASVRKAHATFGGSKFPIFDKHSAKSALHLIGHAPKAEQAKIRAKAAKYLKSGAKMKTSMQHEKAEQDHDSKYEHHMNKATDEMRNGDSKKAMPHLAKAHMHRTFRDMHTQAAKAQQRTNENLFN